MLYESKEKPSTKTENVQTHVKLTPEEETTINLDRLAHDVRYQLAISDRYGIENAVKLIRKAKNGQPAME